MNSFSPDKYYYYDISTGKTKNIFLLNDQLFCIHQFKNKEEDHVCTLKNGWGMVCLCAHANDERYTCIHMLMT